MRLLQKIWRACKPVFSSFLFFIVMIGSACAFCALALITQEEIRVFSLIGSPSVDVRSMGV